MDGASPVAAGDCRLLRRYNLKPLCPGCELRLKPQYQSLIRGVGQQKTRQARPED